MSVTDSLPFGDIQSVPDFSVEQRQLKEGRRWIAGVDEAGRGPLAGPVVAAAVVLNPDNIPEGLNDSKKLTKATRENLFADVCSSSHVAWCSIPARVIDDINIREAALLAMTKSVRALAVTTDSALIDGRDVPEGLTSIGTALIKGDARSLSIAAASIVAKVVRDRMMVRASFDFPDYGFASHKGYGSKSHREAIARHGPCPIHRRSFSPIRQMI